MVSTRLAALLGFLALVVPSMSQDYTTYGNYSVGSKSQRMEVNLSLAASSRRLRDSPVLLDVIVTYPSNASQASGAGGPPFPVVAMFSGFMAQAQWYSGIVNRVASWGYVVLQYNYVNPLLSLLSIEEELRYLPPLLQWLSNQGAAATTTTTFAAGGSSIKAPSSPLAGLPDTGRLAVMGHSRGGAVASWHYTGNATNVTTAVLIDPVDNVDLPACKQLAAANRTAAVVGAGISGPFNSAAQNYSHFFSALAPGSWQMVVRQAGHLQFLSTGSSLADRALDLAARSGKIARQDAIRDAASLAVAWLQSAFRPAGASAGAAAYRNWLQAQVAAGVITFNISAASASGSSAAANPVAGAS